MGFAGVCPSAVRVSMMRYVLLASSAGRLGIGESPVKTTVEPTARTAVHGQLAVHAVFSAMATASAFSGEPS